MKHKELLAEIDKQQYSDYKSWGSIPEWPYKALRAIVELHRPQEGWNDLEVCNECSSDSNYEWLSCPTIEAIEKELAR